MSKVKLSGITSVITKGTTPMTIGFNFQDKGINFVKIESIAENSDFIFNKFQHISDECNVKMKRSILFENDILFSIAGALGRTAIVTKDILPANTNQALAIIRLSTRESCPKYIQYVLKSESVYNQFQKQKQGVAQLNLSLKNIGDLEIPFPPLQTQKQIAKTLDTAAELLAMRKQQLAELDDLIKSTFYDMFGDPVRNDKGWEIKALNDVCIKITDGTHDTPKRVEDGVLFITGKNIRPFSIELSDIEYVSLEDHEIIYKRCNPQMGDILYTNIGVNYGTAAKCTLDFEFSMKNVALLKIDSEVTESVYLECVLNYKRDYIINQNQTGGAQTFMGLATIKRISVAVPPISIQNQFANIVTKIEEQKALVKKAIDETQYLFDSLMSEYFE